MKLRRILFSLIINMTSLTLTAPADQPTTQYAPLAQTVKQLLSSDQAVAVNVKIFLQNMLATQPLTGLVKEQAVELLTALDSALAFDWEKIEKMRNEYQAQLHGSSQLKNRPENPELKKISDEMDLLNNDPVNKLTRDLMNSDATEQLLSTGKTVTVDVEKLVNINKRLDALQQKRDQIYSAERAQNHAAQHKPAKPTELARSEELMQEAGNKLGAFMETLIKETNEVFWLKVAQILAKAGLEVVAESAVKTGGPLIAAPTKQVEQVPISPNKAGQK